LKNNFRYTREYKTKDGIPFQLRPAEPSDAEIIETNIEAVCKEKIYLYSDSFVLTHEWRKVLEKSIDENSGDLLIVADVGTEVIGHLRLFSEWYGPKGRHVGIIGLSIIRNWRRRAIGSAMLSYGIEWAKFARFEKLNAAIIASNLGALKLFRKFGFQKEGRRKKQFKIDGIYYDELLLARFLDNSKS
jgi:RimJ/RimL family protein N-acetyltransferase